MTLPQDRAPGTIGTTEGWSRRVASRVEDLSDAVLGAGLEVTQMSRGALSGSLAFAERAGILYSSGRIDGRVALVGPLSQDTTRRCFTRRQPHLRCDVARGAGAAGRGLLV